MVDNMQPASVVPPVYAATRTRPPATTFSAPPATTHTVAKNTRPAADDNSPPNLQIVRNTWIRMQSASRSLEQILRNRMSTPKQWKLLSQTKRGPSRTGVFRRLLSALYEVEQETNMLINELFHQFRIESMGPGINALLQNGLDLDDNKDVWKSSQAKIDLADTVWQRFFSTAFTKTEAQTLAQRLMVQRYLLRYMINKASPLAKKYYQNTRKAFKKSNSTLDCRQKGVPSQVCTRVQNEAGKEFITGQPLHEVLDVLYDTSCQKMQPSANPSDATWSWGDEDESYVCSLEAKTALLVDVVNYFLYSGAYGDDTKRIPVQASQDYCRVLRNAIQDFRGLSFADLNNMTVRRCMVTIWNESESLGPEFGDFFMRLVSADSGNVTDKFQMLQQVVDREENPTKRVISWLMMFVVSLTLAVSFSCGDISDPKRYFPEILTRNAWPLTQHEQPATLSLNQKPSGYLDSFLTGNSYDTELPARPSSGF